MDESPLMRQRALARDVDGRVKCELADAAWGLPGGPFDAIVLIDSWEFFPGPVALMQDARRVIDREGQVIILSLRVAWRPPIAAAEWTGMKKLRRRTVTETAPAA